MAATSPHRAPEHLRPALHTWSANMHLHYIYLYPFNTEVLASLEIITKGHFERRIAQSISIDAECPLVDEVLARCGLLAQIHTTFNWHIVNSPSRLEHGAHRRRPSAKFTASCACRFHQCRAPLKAVSSLPMLRGVAITGAEGAVHRGPEP